MNDRLDAFYTTKAHCTEKDYLTYEQEVELARIYRTGTAKEKHDAREKLFRSQYNLVIKLAYSSVPCTFMSFEDKLQEGLLGLLVAIEKFDPEKGRLSTYARNWINQKIRRAVHNCENLIRLPVHISAHSRQLTRLRDKVFQDTGAMPSHEELMEMTGLLECTYRTVTNSEAIRVLSLDAPYSVKEDGDAVTLLDIIPAAKENKPSGVDRTAALATIALAISRLTPKQQYIIKERFGLNSTGEVKTLEQVGKELRLTRERIRQIEGRVLRRFRKMGEITKSLAIASEAYRMN